MFSFSLMTPYAESENQHYRCPPFPISSYIYDTVNDFPRFVNRAKGCVRHRLTHLMDTVGRCDRGHSPEGVARPSRLFADV